VTGLLDTGQDYLDWITGQGRYVPAQPFSYANNSVGTESTTQQNITAQRGPFDPGVTLGNNAVIPQSAYDRMWNMYNQNEDAAANIAGVPAAAEARATAAALRRVRPGARPARAAIEPPVNDGLPELPPRGHNQPPEMLPEGLLAPGAPRRAPAELGPPPGAPQGLLAGRLGSNADDELAKLGLPTYRDVVPSAATGPVTEEQLKAGSPARPGQVFDLSETWRVPATAQAPLDRLDPNEGRRKGLPAHIQQVVNDPEMAAKLRGIAEAGLKAGGAYWYNAEPLRNHFVTELGEEEGNKQFNRFMSIVGPTSAGSDVGQNVRTASYYLTQERAGTPVKSKEDLIHPYGHKMQGEHIRAYGDLDLNEGGALDPGTQPKRASFVANLQGNQEPVTVDKHNIRLIGMLSQNPAFLNTALKADVNYPNLNVTKGETRNWRDEVTGGNVSMEQALQHPHMWQDVPNPLHYGALEDWQKGIAKGMGLTPAQFQAALWVGGGRITGLRSLPTSFMGTVENRLANTAAKRGGTPQQALLDFIHGRHPLLTPALTAGLGAGALSGLLDPAGSPAPEDGP
jgi:hypothetical protein